MTTYKKLIMGCTVFALAFSGIHGMVNATTLDLGKDTDLLIADILLGEDMEVAAVNAGQTITIPCKKTNAESCAALKANCTNYPNSTQHCQENGTNKITIKCKKGKMVPVRKRHPCYVAPATGGGGVVVSD